MAHFAKIERGVVLKVITAEASFFDTFVDDYKDRSQRKHYAGVGYSYDKTKDVFIPPQPFSSWTLNETTYTWEPPTAYPTDGKLYDWDENTKSWVEFSS